MKLPWHKERRGEGASGERERGGGGGDTKTEIYTRICTEREIAKEGISLANRRATRGRGGGACARARGRASWERMTRLRPLTPRNRFVTSGPKRTQLAPRCGARATPTLSCAQAPAETPA